MIGQFLATIDDQDHGRFSLMTETGSIYIVDIDAATVRREAGARGPDEPTGARSMGRDGVELELIAYAECSIGSRAEFLIDLRLPAGYMTTTYTTSMVLSILQIDDSAASTA